MKRAALIPDNGMRARDEHFDDSAKYKQKPDPLHDKGAAKKAAPLYGQDFTFDRDAHTCVCPAGKPLYGNGRECKIGGYIASSSAAAKALACPARSAIDACARPTRPGRGRLRSSPASCPARTFTPNE